MSQTGKYCRNYFTRKGELKHIHNLRFWPLQAVLREKYRLAPNDAEQIAAFLVPCLEQVPGKRATAASALQSSWLTEPVSLYVCLYLGPCYRVVGDIPTLTALCILACFCSFEHWPS